MEVVSQISSASFIVVWNQVWLGVFLSVDLSALFTVDKNQDNKFWQDKFKFLSFMPNLS